MTTMVGTMVGTTVGTTVGPTVGPTVGGNVGDTVGLDVGEAVGLIVGLMVGDAVGDVVGLTVGLTVGLKVGEIVGEVVGSDVVGEVVGDSVAHETFCPLLQNRSRRIPLRTGTTALQLVWLAFEPFLAEKNTGSKAAHSKYASAAPSGAPRSTLSRWIWAFSKSTTVWSHCTRSSPGGASGAVLSTHCAVLVLSTQVRFELTPASQPSRIWLSTSAAARQTHSSGLPIWNRESAAASSPMHCNGESTTDKTDPSPPGSAAAAAASSSQLRPH